MSKKYTFICVDSDNQTETMTTLTTDESTWQAPVDLFFNFLKGTGYLFNLEEELCVVNTQTEEIRDRL